MSVKTNPQKTETIKSLRAALAKAQKAHQRECLEYQAMLQERDARLRGANDLIATLKQYEASYKRCLAVIRAVVV